MSEIGVNDNTIRMRRHLVDHGLNKAHQLRALGNPKGGRCDWKFWARDEQLVPTGNISWILVDFPEIAPEVEEVVEGEILRRSRTLADDIREGVRPWWRLYPALNVPGVEIGPVDQRHDKARAKAGPDRDLPHRSSRFVGNFGDLVRLAVPHRLTDRIGRADMLVPDRRTPNSPRQSIKSLIGSTLT